MSRSVFAESLRFRSTGYDLISTPDDTVPEPRIWRSSRCFRTFWLVEKPVVCFLLFSQEMTEIPHDSGSANETSDPHGLGDDPHDKQEIRRQQDIRFHAS